MARLLLTLNVMLFVVALILSGGRQFGLAQSQQKPVTRLSPNRRYEVRFSDARPASFNQKSSLWGTITVRDLKTGKEGIARVAAGQGGRDIWEGFTLYEPRDAWSPDGLYLVYGDDQCMGEGSVPGGIVCHLHELRFLSMEPDSACADELVLGRYTFGGWAPGQSHTVLETLVNEAGEKVQRLPCAHRNPDGSVQDVPVKYPEHAIALFQNYWNTIVVGALHEKKLALWKNMSERVQTKNKLSARLESSRKIYERVKDTLGPSEQQTLILYGAMADLDREGQVWVIESFTGCPCSEVAGYVDAKTGRLIFVWVMPEG